MLEANEDAENLEDFEDDTAYVDFKYDLRWDDLIVFDLVAAIDRDTIKTLDGGKIYFEAMLPTGRTLRFSGTGVEITPEGLLLKPDARLCALDSIGRLCAMKLTQPQRSEAGDCVYLSGGYTFTDATEVESSDELYLIWGSVTNIEDSLIMRYMDFQPNFIYFGADKSNSEALALSKVMVYYDEMTFATPIRAMALNSEMYGTYMAGANSEGGVMGSTFSYANFITYGNTGEMAGSHENPSIKNYLSINSLFLNDNTLIHEYAHGFGLVDYYDVTGMGIDAVGGFDMQSQNAGDWNAYSKYAAFDGPFGEYLILDLFTDGGANRFDAAKYGLSDAVGVRISHVNATMEKRVQIGTDGVEYPFGSVCRGNAYNEDGRYLLEVVQAGGGNSFTDLDNLHANLQADDLFKAGDVFTAEAYDAFFKDGRMNDGSALGYSVEILKIEADADGAYSAQIRITRK